MAEREVQAEALRWGEELEEATLEEATRVVERQAEEEEVAPTSARAVQGAV